MSKLSYTSVDAEKIGKMLLTHEEARIERVKRATIPAAEQGVELVREHISPNAVKLRESITAEHTKAGESVVGSAASHARAYELGTRNRKPHPFMLPTLPQAQKNLDTAVETAQKDGDTSA